MGTFVKPDLHKLLFCIKIFANTNIQICSACIVLICMRACYLHVCMTFKLFTDIYCKWGNIRWAKFLLFLQFSRVP